MKCASSAAVILSLLAATEIPAQENRERRNAYGLKDLYLAYIDQVAASANPIPGKVRVRLLRLVGKPEIPFTQQDIENARYTLSTTSEGRSLFPTTYGVDKVAGITHDRLIVMLPNAISVPNCKTYAVWAHELTHVAQNRRDGREHFLNTYLADAARFDYREIPYEAEAYKVEMAVSDRYCVAMEGIPSAGRARSRNAR